MGVILHNGAAAGRVDDDRVQRPALLAFGMPDVDIPLREGLGACLFSHMQSERAATALPFGKRDVIAEMVEKADGGVIQFGAHDPLGASAQQGDAASPRPVRFHRLRRCVNASLERAFWSEFQERPKQPRS